MAMGSKPGSEDSSPKNDFKQIKSDLVSKKRKGNEVGYNHIMEAESPDPFGNKRQAAFDRISEEGSS